MKTKLAIYSYFYVLKLQTECLYLQIYHRVETQDKAPYFLGMSVSLSVLVMCGYGIWLWFQFRL